MEPWIEGKAAIIEYILRRNPPCWCAYSEPSNSGLDYKSVAGKRLVPVSVRVAIANIEKHDNSEYFNFSN